MDDHSNHARIVTLAKSTRNVEKIRNKGLAYLRASCRQEMSCCSCAACDKDDDSIGDVRFFGRFSLCCVSLFSMFPSSSFLII